MKLLSNQTRVLIPEKVRIQKKQLSNKDYLALVAEYLSKYEDYQLDYVIDCYAICIRSSLKTKRSNGK